MAAQIKGPLGTLLVQMALAGAREEKEAVPTSSADRGTRSPQLEVADYLERVIRAAAKAADQDGEPLVLMPQA